MAILNIVEQPSDFLRKKSKPVENFDSRLKQLVQDMTDTVSNLDAEGIAAVQVGVLKRVCLIREGDDYLTLINPIVIKQSNYKVYLEGCLSVPEIHGKVKRPNTLTVEFYDINGNKKARDFEGFICQIIGHEMDHFDGILFTDKLEDDDSEQ